MDNEARVRQLDEGRLGQRHDHRRKFGEEAPLEIVVGDVADRYEYSVCIASCPAAPRRRASRRGNCASTRSFTLPAAGRA
jgi:hypothetical protein